MAVIDTPLGVSEHPGVEHEHEEAGRPSRWRGKLGIWIPGAMLALVVAACFLGPLVFGLPKPTGGGVLNSYLPTGSPGHLLGTAGNGNDTHSRLLYGGRASLLIAVTVNLLGLLVGGTLGALSGQIGEDDNTLIFFVFVLL